MQIPFELNNLLLAITVAVTAMITLNKHRRENRLTESTQSVNQRVKADAILQKEVEDRVKPLTVEFTKQTKHALFTAHYKYLSKPYKLMQAKAHQLKNKQGTIANRRNHGILHTIRTTAYIQAILHESILAKKITPEQKKSMQQQLEIAACFDITGREDESGQKSNPVRYKESRDAAVENFKKYVKNNKWAKQVFKDDEKFIDQFAEEVILHRGSTMAKDAYFKTCSQVLGFAHNLDLARCKNPSEYTQYNQSLEKWLGGNSEGFDRLKQLAKSCIIETGNSLKGYQNEVREYDTEKYVSLVSQEPGYFGYRENRRETFDEKKASPAQTIILDSLKQCYQDKKANPTPRP